MVTVGDKNEFVTGRTVSRLLLIRPLLKPESLTLEVDGARRIVIELDAVEMEKVIKTTRFG